MKLYFKQGACSKATHIVLNELGLDYSLDRVHPETGLTASGKDYKSINPNGYVPALELESGEVLTEGAAILQFLADQHMHAVLAPPVGSVERAHSQSLLAFVSAELHKAFKPFFSQGELSKKERDAAVAHVGSRFDYLEGKLADGHDFLCGEAFTISDAYAYVVLAWAGGVGIDTSPWPRIEAYLARIGERESVQQATAAEEAAA